MKMLVSCVVMLFGAGAAAAQTTPAPPVLATPTPADSVRKPMPPNTVEVPQETTAPPVMTQPEPDKKKEKRKRTRLRTNPNFPE